MLSGMLRPYRGQLFLLLAARILNRLLFACQPQPWLLHHPPPPASVLPRMFPEWVPPPGGGAVPLAWRWVVTATAVGRRAGPVGAQLAAAAAAAVAAPVPATTQTRKQERRGSFVSSMFPSGEVRVRQGETHKPPAAGRDGIRCP